jgi:hypothetical protein
MGIYIARDLDLGFILAHNTSNKHQYALYALHFFRTRLYYHFQSSKRTALFQKTTCQRRKREGQGHTLLCAKLMHIVTQVVTKNAIVLPFSELYTHCTFSENHLSEKKKRRPRAHVTMCKTDAPLASTQCSTRIYTQPFFTLDYLS